MLMSRITNIVFLAGLVLLVVFRSNLQPGLWYVFFAWLGLYLFIQFLGSYFIGLNYHLRSQNTLRTHDKTVALTFDDGPHSFNTAKVLDVLQKHQVKATFFIIGRLAVGQEAILQRIVAEGHRLGNHSYSHAFWFDLWPTGKVAADLAACQQQLEHYQAESALFRPPYGVTNPNIRRALDRLGLRSVGWNIRSYDTSIKDPARIRQRILQRLRPGAIILLHDRLDLMPDLLDQLIPAIKEKNYTFGMIS